MPEKLVSKDKYKVLRGLKKIYTLNTKYLIHFPVSQSGFITSYVVVLFLLAGIGLGVYLVQMRQVYKSKATSQPISGPVVSPLPTNNPSVSPSSLPTVDTLFTGEYFSNPTLYGQPAFIRKDSEINFDWGRNSPAAVIPKDKFSIRWTKNVSLEGGEYTFVLNSDDGMRVYINNDLIINDWKNHSARKRVYKRRVPFGIHTLKVEYYENRGRSQAGFSFQKN